MLNPILLELATQRIKSAGELKGPHQPPGYRMAAGEVSRCASCKNFVQGHCKKFKVAVDSNFVCDEWEGADMHLPAPAAISPGAGVIGGAVPIAAGAGTDTDIKMSSDNYITPQIDQGPVTAAPIKSDKREGAMPTDQVEQTKKPLDVNNNPKATAQIFGMQAKAAALIQKAAQGAGGGGASGGASPGNGSTGISAPSGYGDDPSPQQIHQLQVGFPSGSRRRKRKHLEEAIKSANLLANSMIGTANLNPPAGKSMPNVAQAVQAPMAKPLVGAQPGDPSFNPGPPTGPRGTTSQPIGQQSQAQPQDPNQTQQQGGGVFTQTVPTPPVDVGVPKMAGSLPMDVLADIAARVKIASDAPPAPPKPKEPVQPAALSRPKLPRPTIKTARMSKKLLAGRGDLFTNSQGGESNGQVKDRSDQVVNHENQSGNINSVSNQVNGYQDKLAAEKAPPGASVTVETTYGNMTPYQHIRYQHTKLAAIAFGTQPDQLAIDLTGQADQSSLLGPGALTRAPATARGMQERLLGRGKSTRPSPSSGDLMRGFDPMSIAKGRQATSNARVALDIAQPPPGSAFQPARFKTLLQIASTGDNRAYGQLSAMMKSLEETNQDPVLLRMAQMRMRDLEMQHPHFTKVSMALRLGDIAAKMLVKSAVIPLQSDMDNPQPTAAPPGALAAPATGAPRSNWFARQGSRSAAGATPPSALTMPTMPSVMRPWSWFGQQGTPQADPEWQRKQDEWKQPSEQQQEEWLKTQQPQQSEQPQPQPQPQQEQPQQQPQPQLPTMIPPHLVRNPRFRQFMRHRQEQQFAQTPEGQAYQQWKQPKLTAAAQAAQEELRLNPGLARRPDERGETGFTSWQSRMRDLRAKGLNTAPAQQPAQAAVAPAAPPAPPAAGGMPGGMVGRKAAPPTPTPTVGTPPAPPKNVGGAPPASGQGKGGTPVVARPATNPGQGSNQTPYS